MKYQIIYIDGSVGLSYTWPEILDTVRNMLWYAQAVPEAYPVCVEFA